MHLPHDRPGQKPDVVVTTIHHICSHLQHVCPISSVHDFDEQYP